MQLFECLQSIPDPRKKRGIRHPFQPVLKFVLLGFTCRLLAIEHMVSFFKPIWNELKASLGFNRPEPPDPTTIRRMLNGLKPEQLQEAFEQWVSELIGNKTFMASVNWEASQQIGKFQMLWVTFGCIGSGLRPGQPHSLHESLNSFAIDDVALSS